MNIAFGTGTVEYEEPIGLIRHVYPFRINLKTPHNPILNFEEAERLHRELGAALEHAKKVEGR